MRTRLATTAIVIALGFAAVGLAHVAYLAGIDRAIGAPVAIAAVAACAWWLDGRRHT
ncbi:hypothetical protein ACIBSV_47000 [Embleya sp. NPDC050154]|uniref:hypothetical protein n=1 Tax=Embleya sp. NPDC050154 TaxID=3363988 RepID=UPI0037B37904